MPGSRRSEISYHAKLIFDAANKLKIELATSGIDSVRFLVPSKFPDLKDILIKYHLFALTYFFMIYQNKTLHGISLQETEALRLGTVQYLWQYGTGKFFFPGPKVAMAPYDFILK